MANPLTINRNPFGMGMDNVIITGFTDEELYKLKCMEHHDAIDAVVEMLDSRNQGKGQEFRSGYGICSLWFDNEAVYMRVGESSQFDGGNL